MNKHSIFLKIIGLFLFALISFFAFSFYFIQGQIEKERVLSAFKYRQVTVMINRLIKNTSNAAMIDTYLHELGFEKTKDPLIEQALLGYKDELLGGYRGLVAKFIRLKNDIFILIQDNDSYTLYSDHIKSSYKNYYIITFGAILLLVFLFLLILKSLMPLKVLNKKIKKFADGNLDINCEINQKDEIGELSHEFQMAVDTIKTIQQGRQLFLRSIMHELKTPITTGRITAEMVENKVYRKRLCNAFTRLNFLIDEFAKIEQLASKAYNLKKCEFDLEQLINIVKEMLLLPSDDTSIEVLRKDVLIKADLDLFALSIKNLIDNALKYKTSGHIEIDATLDRLIISNKGAPLKADLNKYFKPYFKSPDESANAGFGLGLYIIKSTLDIQGFTLHYEHEPSSIKGEAGTNYFSILGCVVALPRIIGANPKACMP